MSQFMLSKNAETVSFAGLKALLLCKDMEKYEFLNQLTQGEKCLFLDGTVDLHQECDKVSLSSFARSGNTFLR